MLMAASGVSNQRFLRDLVRPSRSNGWILRAVLIPVCRETTAAISPHPVQATLHQGSQPGLPLTSSTAFAAEFMAMVRRA